jgi:predicted GIY-YIG superfamily endonuclease
MPIVYLIHFETPLKHARHYLGFTNSDLEDRLARHRAGGGSKLMRAIKEAKINWSVVRTWEGENVDRNFERRLKNRKQTHVFCPICRGSKPVIDLKTDAFTPTKEVPF